MGEISGLDELRLAEMKREKFRRSFEQAQAKVSDILLFAVQWKDLERHYDLVESKLEKRSLEVELKEKELGTKSLALEERASKIEAAEAEAGVLKRNAEGFRREVEANQKVIGFLQNRVEACKCELKSEEKKLTEIRRLVGGCEMDLSSKSKQLVVMQESVEKTHGELQWKQKQLRRTKTELVRCRDEVGAEKENLGNIQNNARQLKEDSDRKRKDLVVAFETQAKCSQQLALVEEQLASRQKLLEIRSSELESKEKELDAVRESIKSCDLDLDLKRWELQSLENSITESCEHLESKRVELGEIQKLIEEQTHELGVKLKRLDSIELLIQKNLEELAAKEKRQEEMAEALRSCSLEIECKEKLAGTEETVKKLLEKLHLKEKRLDSTQRHLNQCTIELKSKQKDLDVVKEALRKHSKDLELKQRVFNSLQFQIIDYGKQIETREKKVLDLESSIEDISCTLSVKKDMLSSVERSFKNLTDELASKEHELSSVKMKIEETVKENESREEKYMRLGVSLKTREEELELKEKQFDARVKSFELKEQQLESKQKKFAKCVEDFEEKERKMSSLCHQGNTDQSGDLLKGLKPKDDKSLQLLINGYLKKCPQLHVKVSDALKASPDPARLVLDMIQWFYSPHPSIKEAEFDENVVRKSCIHLLECLMAVSPEIKPGVQAEAIKLAIEFKNKTRVKTENAVEALSFLYFLAAFSLAFALGGGELQSIFDVVTLRKFAPSLCKALGLSALASVNDVFSSDVKFEQPLDVPINDNDTCSLSLDIQQNTAASDPVCQLPPHDVALMDSEVSAALRSSPDPAKFVLDLIQGEIRGTNQQGEKGFEESVANYCVLLLEELMKVSRYITPHVRFEASKLAILWKGKLQIGTPTSLQALGFLLFLAAYDLVAVFSRDEISSLACYVAFYKHAPKLFKSLGLSDVIRDLVLHLVGREQCIPAARLICSFELNSILSPMPLLKKEIEDLRRSTNGINVEKTSVDSQTEGEDFRKMRAILELIADYKLEIDLPGDLVAKFMFQRGNQSQSVFSSVPIRLPALTPAAQMQPQSIAIYGSNPSYPATPGALPHPQALGAYNYQASHTQSLNQVGLKRARSESVMGRPLLRPCMNPRSHFHPPGNGGW